MAWDARTMVSRGARQAKRGPPPPPLKAGKGIMLMLDGPPCSRPAFLKHREAHGTGRGGNFELPMSTTVNELRAKLVEASYGATDLWAACWQGTLRWCSIYLQNQPPTSTVDGQTRVTQSWGGAMTRTPAGNPARSCSAGGPQCHRRLAQAAGARRRLIDELIYIFLAGTVLFLLRSTVLNTILISHT